jgi:hypothetical protein
LLFSSLSASFVVVGSAPLSSNTLLICCLIGVKMLGSAN